MTMNPDPTTNAPATPGEGRRLLSFRLVAGILIAAAVVLNVTVPTMKVTFRKQPVDPRRSLKTLPIRLGHWTQISVDTPLNHDVEQTLAANEYVFRTYVDDRKVPKDVIAKFATLSPDQCLQYAHDISKTDPSAVINFAMTYYTGSVDTVAHIPDRCYIADGFEVTAYETYKWPVLPRPEGPKDLELRYLTFENHVDSRSVVNRNVAYFFNVNGSYESDPINGVRKRLQNLLEKYGYYSKVELNIDTNDTRVAQTTMRDFLLNAMPEIEQVLPDWQEIKARKN